MDTRSAEKQGYQAYLAGDFVNPYDPENDHDLYWAWDEGFSKASEDD